MEKLRIWVDSLFFSNFILIVVFVNSVTLGLQPSNTIMDSIGEATINSKQSFTESNVKVKEEIRIVEDHLAILKKCLDNTRGQGYSQK